MGFINKAGLGGFVALLPTTAALTVAFVAVTWASLKLVKWSLNAESPETRQIYVGHITSLFRTTVALLAVVELWPGVANWTANAWHYLQATTPLP